MPGPVKRLLQAAIVLCHVYLFAHSQEPLRLNLGDPWSDANVLTSIKYVKSYGFLATSFTDILDVGPLTEQSYRYTHYPPLAEITYGAIGKYLGVTRIETYRVFALVFSALAMWCLFHYTRRMYGEAIGLIATALWSTSLLWMTYADSIHQAPIFQLATWFGLWGLERAIATRRRRHYAAAILGAFGAFLTSYDGWLFFPAAVLVTVYTKAGNPFARANRHFVAWCAAGCVLAIVAKSLFVIGAVGWGEFVADLHFQFLERSTSTFDRSLDAATPTIIRRVTMGFSPLVWIAVGYHAIRAIRAASLKAAFEDTAAWMLACAIAFLYLFSQLAASQWLPSQVVLPFYAIGSALVIERLIRGRTAARVAGYAWLIGAPLWTGYALATHDRSVLPTDEVERANRYLAANDHNDFLLNNLESAGIIQAYFDRHTWSAPDMDVPHQARLFMLSTFEQTGTESVHALIFKRPGSRFIDKTLWPMAVRAKQWSIAGMPMIWRAKTNRFIAARDRDTFASMGAVGAVKVVEGSEFDVYRIDRATVVARLVAAVPSARFIDLGGPAADRHTLLGWTRKADAAVSVASGRISCPLPPGTACQTVLTKEGIRMPQLITVEHAELMIRATGACDLTLRVQFGRPVAARITVDRYVYDQPDFAATTTFTIPKAALRLGINTLSFAERVRTLAPAPRGIPVATIEIDEPCAPPAWLPGPRP